jgi:hypothetical protein
MRCKNFKSTDPPTKEKSFSVMQRYDTLPPQVQQRIPCLILAKSVVCNALPRQLLQTAMNGQRFTIVAHGFKQAQTELGLKLLQAHGRTITARMTSFGPNSLAVSSTQADGGSALDGGQSILDMVTRLSYAPGSKHLINMFHAATPPDVMASYEDKLRLNGGQCLSFDWNFQIHKHVRAGGSHEAMFGATFKVENEYNVILTIAFTHGKSLDEVKPILMGLRRRYKLLGLQPVRYIWVDDYGAFHAFLYKVFPSLTQVLQDVEHIYLRHP